MPGNFGAPPPDWTYMQHALLPRRSVPHRPLFAARRSVIAVAALFALVTAGCGSSADPAAVPLAGMVRTPTPHVDLAGFTDDQGVAVEFAPPATDGIELVYFGYTLCPDVCPTTLADVRSALRTLDDTEVAKYGLTFVTIDPARDTDEVVDSYVQSFVTTAQGVRIDDDAELARLAERFGATYSHETAADGSIEVGHSAFLYAVDTAGNLLVSWPFGTTKNELARDFSTLLARLE